MLEKIKLALRVSSSVTDEDILDLIEACKIDLKISGINRIKEDDPLIIQAVKLYCKANYGIDNSESDKYTKCYDSLKVSLSLCGDYNVE
ncbi:head-tail connector protein [uncultured Clostridium sp.]|uniref:head-tail connector protein n=1 Tax=uncultured Clostridium sp. TaxID=59620 RepID=UPI0025D285EF|nr:head-tail connector protein [uncultured Clostridium sp.]